MNGTNKTTQVGFRSLPVQIRRQLQQYPLLVQAQKRYLQSRAPFLSNETYWRKIVERFETDKLNDHTLDPHINTFLDRLADTTKSVVEFGCGIGRAAVILESRGFRNYIGIDVAERASNRTRLHLTNPNLSVAVNQVLIGR